MNSASRTLNRVNDINLNPNNKEALESVMVAMAASGRVQEAVVISQMLEKTSVQTDIASAIGELRHVIQGIKQPTTTNTVEDTVTLSQDEYNALLNK
tara:strand:+ start:164 stop:454 length:291 start_codon:yes stop_codon:yes gene_type:complete